MLLDLYNKEKVHPRFDQYEVNLDLFTGEHYKVFNHDEQSKKLHEYEYICYDLLKEAINIKTNLIWQNSPTISFTKPKLQKEWDELRLNTNFDYIMQMVTTYMYVFGDSLLKIAVDQNTETASEDYQISLYLQDPENWFPEYNPASPSRPARSNTLVFEKEIREANNVKFEAYLFETHYPGKIVWTSYVERDEVYSPIPPLRYFGEELANVLANNPSLEALEIVYETNCTYSLLQRLQNAQIIDDYFGVSDFTLPVKSKINVLNNYANLADSVIVTNSFPKLILSENASKILQKITESYNEGRTTNQDVENPGIDLPKSFLDEPRTAFMSKQSYANTFIYTQLMQNLKAFEDGGRGETKYLQNDFDLQQIREQHNIMFKSLMSELGISEVFYNPSLTTGATSGTAYKRLMTITLNAIATTKRQLEPFIKKVVYTMLELAKDQGLISSKPEMPTVEFKDGLVDDNMEQLQLIVQKYQAQLIPHVKAIQLANDITEEEAQSMLDEMEIENELSTYNGSELPTNSGSASQETQPA